MATSFIVITLNREFNYACREQNHFLFHWNTLISSGQTHTDLDVAQEKRIDDYCNVDGNRNLSDSWTGFTRFTLLNETPPRGCMWYGERLTKSLRHLAQIIYGLTLRQGLEKPLKEKKNKNGQLRNQNSNMPENWEILFLLIQAMKSTRTSLKKVRRKLETPKTAAMPCKKNVFQSMHTGHCCLKNQNQGVRCEDKIQLYCWRGRASDEKDSWRTHCRERAKFCIVLQLSV